MLSKNFDKCEIFDPLQFPQSRTAYTRFMSLNSTISIWMFYTHMFSNFVSDTESIDENYGNFQRLLLQILENFHP